jgi:YD repeat-containing protein
LATGDCDRNGTVTISEVQSSINMFLGLKTPALCVDEDNNGSVTIAEVQRTINTFLGLLPANTQAPTITSATDTTFNTGITGNFTFTASGNPAPTISISDNLPTGVTYNTATGVLSGSPLGGATGSYRLTITANNGVSPTIIQYFTLTVDNLSSSNAGLSDSAKNLIGTAGPIKKGAWVVSKKTGPDVDTATYSYVFDTSGNLVKKTEVSTYNQGKNNYFLTETYNTLGQENVTTSNSTSNFIYTSTYSYTYDSSGRISTKNMLQTAVNDTDINDGYFFTYSSSGLSVENTTSGKSLGHLINYSTTNLYDTNFQIIQYGSGSTYVNKYLHSNQLSNVFTYGSNNKLINLEYYTYLANGKIYSKTFGDPTGLLSVSIYSYDSNGNVSTIVTTSGSQISTVSYTYIMT